MSSEEAQIQPAPLDQERVPINSDNFHRWLDRIRGRYEMDETLKQLFGEEIIDAIKFGLTVVQPWINDASINIVKDSESFKYAAKRKSIGIGETIRQKFYHHMQKCTDAINRLQHLDVEKLSTADKDLQESVRECLKLIRRGSSLIISFMVAIDTLTGALTSNMPEDLIPNALKGRVGYFSR